MGSWKNNQFQGDQRESAFDCIAGDCKNGEGERKYKNGDHYKGSLLERLYLKIKLDL